MPGTGALTQRYHSTDFFYAFPDCENAVPKLLRN